MKKYITGLMMAAAVMVGSTSCSDFLDEPVLGQQDLGNYFSNEDECARQVTGCYQSLAFDDWWQIYKFYVCGDMCTDDEWMGNTTQDPGEYRDLAHYTGNTINAGNCAQNFWQYRYKGILRCNIAIERIPAVAFNDTTLRARYVGEAKFLRAFQYFDLLRNFGGVPLVMGLKMPEEIQGITRASKEETYAVIEKDLLDAIKVLPKRAEQSSSDLGRATSGAAKGLLAKVYLYQEKYKEAEALLQDLCCRGQYSGNTPEYKLLENFGDVWSIDHNNSEESLFEIQTNNEITYNLGERISVVVGSRDDSGWSWGMPTSHLEKAFKDAGDTIGGVITCVIKGCPVGLGEPEFDKLHAQLGAAMLSINAVKGFEYGEGFAGVTARGSEQNDIFVPAADSKGITTKTNHSGGIQGGLSNGQDIYFRVAFKPVATVLREQQTVDTDGRPVTLTARGRHDPCVLPRAVPIVEAMAAMVVLDNYLLNKTVKI